MTTKAKGRPKIPDMERASEWLPGIRITSAELEQYRAAALNAGLPLSQWARDALAAAVKKSLRIGRKPSRPAETSPTTHTEAPRRLRKALAAADGALPSK